MSPLKESRRFGEARMNAKSDLKGLLIHVGEYSKPSIFDEKRPSEYTLRYARFDENGMTPAGELHTDPEFETYTYGDDPRNSAKRNLGKLTEGDYIFFMWTFLEKNSLEKRRYIPGYLRVKEKLAVEEILRRSLGSSKPYCHNDHVRAALKGKQEEKKFTIFVGDANHSKLCKVPLRLGKKLVEELNLRDSSGNSIASQIGVKRNKHGRLMSEIEVVNIYTRIPKLLHEEQVVIILREMEGKCQDHQKC